MSRILEITLEKPSHKSGGGIGIKQSLISLLGCGEVDYIGQEMTAEEFDATKFADTIFLAYDHNKLSRVWNLLQGVSTGFYSSWKKVKKNIDWKKYDWVHIEFSKYPFLVNEAKRHGKRVLVRLHNVETDYFHNLYLKKKSISSYLRYKIYQKGEERVVRAADKVICITGNDKTRLLELYGKKLEDKIVINPVCTGSAVSDYMTNYEDKKFLITGSLWYGPNADGIIWFVKDVWSKCQKFIGEATLVIAGANPTDELRKLAKEVGHVTIVANPEDMVPFFKDAFCYIAPIFSGAGMKVKVAESMMYGLPMIATKHALVGYAQDEGIWQAEDEEQFINSIVQILSLTHEEYQKMQRNVVALFNNHYSYDTSIKNYQKFLSD